MGKLAIIAFSKDFNPAKKIKDFIGGDILTYSGDAFKLAFGEYGSIIAIMAAGIAVRKIAPLVRDKWNDTTVVVVDSGLNYAIPILGGHHGGNELAKKLAAIGVTPVITTATEVMGKDSVEGIASALGCMIINRGSTKKVNMALLESDVEVLDIKGPKIVIVGDDVSVLKRKGLVVGIGANRGVSKSEVLEAVYAALSELDASIDDVDYFASAMIKENEKGIIDASVVFGKEVTLVPHEIINSIQAPTPSKATIMGIKGVCEPAALAISQEKKLLLKKRIYRNVTIAIAR